MVGVFSTVAAGNLLSLLIDTEGKVWYNSIDGIVPQNTYTDLPPVRSVISNEKNCLFVDINDNIWYCGKNENSQAGFNHSLPIIVPQLLENIIPSTITHISISNTHSLVLDTEGNVWSCGLNNHGQLAVENCECKSRPVKITSLPIPIKSVSCSRSHSLFLDVTGNVWSCGNNESGQLGIEITGGSRTPLKLDNLSAIKSVSCSAFFSIFLDQDGEVWVCGSNKYGQLGMGIVDQVRIPSKLNLASKIRSVATGEAHTLLLDEKGCVYGCGWNNYGQIGAPNQNVTTPNVIPGIPPINSLDCGSTHSVCLDYEGKVWFFGEVAPNPFCFDTLTVQLPPMDGGYNTKSARNWF